MDEGSRASLVAVIVYTSNSFVFRFVYVLRTVWLPLDESGQMRCYRKVDSFLFLDFTAVHCLRLTRLEREKDCLICEENVDFDWKANVATAQ